MVAQTQSFKHDWMPLAGIPLTGLLWSVATVATHAEQVAELGVGLPSVVILVLAGGMAQTVALWVGFSAILWAMIRGFGAHVPLFNVLRLMSAASCPLWPVAPAMAFWFSDIAFQTPLTAVVCLAGLTGFFMLTGQALAKETGWSRPRSLLTVGTAVVFISSFIYLNI